MVRIQTTKATLNEISSGMLAVGLFKDETLPDTLTGAAEAALSDGDFSGKEGETSLLYPGDTIAASPATTRRSR